MRLAIATTFAFIVLPAIALSQDVRIDALSLQAGGRARILAARAGSKYELITVASAGPDSLRYSVDPSLAIKSLAWQEISKMDASTGHHTNVGRDAGIGFLVGLVGGAAGGATISGCCDKEARTLKAVAIVANGLLGGVLGGLVGAVIGHEKRTEDWVPVTLPHTPVASNQRSINRQQSAGLAITASRGIVIATMYVCTSGSFIGPHCSKRSRRLT